MIHVIQYLGIGTYLQAHGLFVDQYVVQSSPEFCCPCCISYSTGILESLNNKLMVAKRIGYGYSDNLFFFILVRFLSFDGLTLRSHLSTHPAITCPRPSASFS